MIEELLTKLKMFGALQFFQNTDTTKVASDILLQETLKAEIKRREQNSLSRRISQAKFTIDREWDQIDHKRNIKIGFKKLMTYSDGKFAKEKKNLCFIGVPGVGKTHSVVSIGKDLCRKGMDVRCYTACSLVSLLEEAKVENRLSKLMTSLMKPSLLIIDELGFVPFSENGARLLFDVFSKRYENGSIAVTTNLSFPKWGQIFGGIELTQALIDRFTHRCDIYVFEGDSVRLMESKNAREQN